MKIYIAGPYTGDELTNTNKMMDVFNELLKKGHVPFCPLLCHFANERHKQRFDAGIGYNDWMRYDVEMLQTSNFDALYLIAHSHGADEELRLAEQLGLTIVKSLEELGCLEETGEERLINE